MRMGMSLLPSVSVCLLLGTAALGTDSSEDQPSGTTGFETRDEAPPVSAEIDRLIEQLGNSQFRKRQAATKALAVIGKPALEALRKTAATTGDAEIRWRSVNLVKTIERQLYPEVRRFEGHSDAVTSVAFSPDGRLILSGSQDCTARLWETASGKELRRFKHPGTVRSVVFSPDGRKALTAGGDDWVRLWDVSTGRELRRFEGEQCEMTCAAFSPDGRRILSGGCCGGLRMWETGSGKNLRDFQQADFSVQVLCIAFSPDGRRVISGGSDELVRVWDVEGGKELCRLATHRCRNGIGCHTTDVTSVAISPDGRLALSAGDHGNPSLRGWELECGKEQRRFGCSGPVYGVAFSPDGRLALTGGGHTEVAQGKVWGFSTLMLWDVQTGKERYCFSGHEREVLGVAFSPDGRHAVSGSADETIRLWRVPKAH